MLNKKKIAGFELFILLVATFAFSYIIASSTPVVAQSTLSEPSFCCEKTKGGGLCINTDEGNCVQGFKSAPTSCETTSYCKLGTCYDSEEGICMANTPQTVCEQNNGTWDEREVGQIPQCQLGCCVIADQAAFVPLVRCKRLSTLFGIESDYRTDIFSEVECIATAQSQDMGACVYESDFERICEFTTRGDCGAREEVESTDINGTEGISVSSQKKFYKDYLCSAEELNTVCARQTSTNCYQGKVYWFDSCGNRENVYSSDKGLSWNSGRVSDASAVCSPNDGSEKNCGNCDYLLGSRCAEWDGFLGMGKPEGSDYYCQDNSCVDRNGKDRKNGEAWCVHDSPSGEAKDPAGALYYRELCVDGEVVVEPCADYRKEVCFDGAIETEDGAYGTAACRANRWQTCLAQIDQEDCENGDRIDCLWLPPVKGMILGAQEGGAGGATSFSNPTAGSTSFNNPTATGSVISPITGQAIFGGDDDEEEVEEIKTNRPEGICVPFYTPGQNFWEAGESQAICGQANAKCIVTFEKGLLGGRDCVENCECLEDGWAESANRVCSALGDCGGYINYKGKYTEDGYKWTLDGKKKKFAPTVVNKISAGFTGLVVGITGLVAGGLGTITGRITTITQSTWDALPPNRKTALEGNVIVVPDPVVGGGEIVSSEDAMKGMKLAKELAEAQKVAGGGASKLPTAAGTKVTPLASQPLDATTGKAGWYSGTTTTTLNAGSGLVPGTTYTAGTAGTTLNFEGASGVVIPAGTEFSVTQAEGLATLTQKTTVDGVVTTTSKTIEGATQMPTTTAAVTGPSTAGTPGSTLSKFLGAGGGGIADALLSGVQWAAIAYGAGQLIGSILGMSKDNTNALSTAMAAGFGSYKLLSTWSQTTGTWMASPLVGIGIGVAVFLLMYKTTDTEIVEFHCKSWQAPTGGNECESCNKGGLPCTEYRCRALGQNCELVNGGTSQEKCVNVNPRDVDQPVITPNENELTIGYKYTNVKPNPPTAGMEVVRVDGDNECIKAFTPLKFGITVNEPAQCKIDFNHTTSFDNMRNFIGGSNLYLYNHSEEFVLPGIEALRNSSLVLENGKDMTFFIRCKDKNGNENSAEYAVKFCIDPSPDNTAPQIKASSIDDGGCVAADTSSGIVEFYTDEPADCRWSHEDQDYDNMANGMICNNQLYQLNALKLFTCSANLTGIARDETRFYVRCKDQPGKEENDRNENAESYKFSLRGSGALKLKNLRPSGTIFGAVSPAPIELYAQTLFGCDESKAICYYSLTGEERDYIMFYDTNKDDGIHTQRLDLTGGVHEIFVKCVDSGGNVAINSTTFTLDINTNAPVVARVYEENELLKIVTVRESECVYSMTDCDFTFAEGTIMPYANSTNHVVEWNEDKTYYIKCRDEFRNEDADCSIIVRPSRKLF